jgi:hypothetical protein
VEQSFDPAADVIPDAADLLDRLGGRVVYG